MVQQTIGILIRKLFVFFYFKETRNLFILQVICKMSNVALLNNMLHSEED